VFFGALCIESYYNTKLREGKMAFATRSDGAMICCIFATYRLPCLVFAKKETNFFVCVLLVHLLYVLICGEMMGNG
jgi:hypothetical protein